jgi:ABC-type multidrug transport system fused ATPase/permease subunit
MEEKIKLLDNWYRRIRRAQRGHYVDAARLKNKNLYFGIPVVILSTVVGAFSFIETKEANMTISIGLAVGFLSISAAVLASLQTFLNFSEKSQQHLVAARQLSSLKKEIEENRILNAHDEKKIDEFINYTRSTWNEITNEAPLISTKVFEKMKLRYGKGLSKATEQG